MAKPSNCRTARPISGARLVIPQRGWPSSLGLEPLDILTGMDAALADQATSGGTLVTEPQRVVDMVKKS